MVREIHIVNPELLKTQLLFDGPVSDKNRREYDTLDQVLDAVKELGINQNRRVSIYLQGYSSDQIKSIRLVLDKSLPKAEYYINIDN